MSADELISHNPLGFPWGQRGGLTVPYRTAPDGMPECRWCAKKLLSTRRRWCGEDCVAAYRFRSDWPFLRKHILKRDRVCRLCNVGASFGVGDLSGEVDHIVAVSEGGTDDPENLRLLCAPCHRVVTAEQRGKWARARKPQQDMLGAC